MDYIFEEDLFEVGAEVDAYCTRCKTDTPHTVVTKYEDEIRSVTCTTCNTTHSYRPPRGETEDDIPEPIAVRRRQASQKLTWETAMQELDLSTAVAYSPKELYAEGQVLEHPTFGLGYVCDVLSDTKLEALFEDGRRLLVHNRQDLIFTAPTGGRRRQRPKQQLEQLKGQKNKAKKPAKAAKAAKVKAPAKAKPAKPTKPAKTKPAKAKTSKPAKAKTSKPAKAKTSKPAKAAKPAKAKTSKPKTTKPKPKTTKPKAKTSKPKPAKATSKAKAKKTTSKAKAQKKGKRGK